MLSQVNTVRQVSLPYLLWIYTIMASCTRPTSCTRIQLLSFFQVPSPYVSCYNESSIVYVLRRYWHMFFPNWIWPPYIPIQIYLDNPDLSPEWFKIFLRRGCHKDNVFLPRFLMQCLWIESKIVIYTGSLKTTFTTRKFSLKRIISFPSRTWRGVCS